MDKELRLTEFYTCNMCFSIFKTEALFASHNRVIHAGAAQAIHKATLVFNGLEVEVSFRDNGRIRIHFETENLGSDFQDRSGAPAIDITMNDSGILDTQQIVWPHGDKEDENI